MHSCFTTMRRKRILQSIIITFVFGVIFCLLMYWYWGLSNSLIPIKKEIRIGNLNYSLEQSLPIPRTEAGGTYLNNRIYIVGGINAMAQTLTSFMAYDIKKKIWNTLPDLPEKINHPAVVAIEEKVWVLGGFGPLGLRPRGTMIANWNPLDTVYVFDPKKNTWSKGPKLLEKRGGGSAVVENEAIWYVGGININKEPSASLFKLNLRSMQWQKMASMAVERDHLKVESVDGVLYAISGRKDDFLKPVHAVEAYNISRNAWTFKKDIPNARGGFGSTVMDGNIYTFGGEHLWSCLRVVEKYDPIKDQWTILPGLPEARHGIVAVSINNESIHLISGGRHPRVSISGIHRVLRINND